jgi:hypothetical protein
MNRFIKIFYHHVPFECEPRLINKCIAETVYGGEKTNVMCGSAFCKNDCKYCFGSGEFHALFLDPKEKKDGVKDNSELVFSQGWIYCGKTLEKRRYYIFRRIMYVAKLKFKKLFKIQN